MSRKGVHRVRDVHDRKQPLGTTLPVNLKQHIRYLGCSSGNAQLSIVNASATLCPEDTVKFMSPRDLRTGVVRAVPSGTIMIL